MFHPDIRHAKRMALRPERNLSMENCDSCGKEMVSVYTSHSPLVKEGVGGDLKEPKVYCEVCYNREVFA
jgi:hypothetical protein